MLIELLTELIAHDLVGQGDRDFDGLGIAEESREPTAIRVLGVTAHAIGVVDEGAGVLDRRIGERVDRRVGGYQGHRCPTSRESSLASRSLTHHHISDVPNRRRRFGTFSLGTLIR